MSEETLFDAIGGEPAVATVVDLLYERLVTDPVVGHQFDPDRLDSLKAAQRDWFRAALSGEASVPTDLAAAHADLDITDAQVTAVLGHLAGSLADAGVPPRRTRSVTSVVGRLWHARMF